MGGGARRLRVAGEVTAPQRRALRGGGVAYVSAEGGDDPAQAALEVPILRGGELFGDEHHRKAKLGRATKHGCSKGLYKGTDMKGEFGMFHDALAQWNGKEAQECIEEMHHGFTVRFTRPVGSTCAGTMYKDKPPGNSPEDARASPGNARGLDSYGFADLGYAMCFNCAPVC